VVFESREFLKNTVFGVIWGVIPRYNRCFWGKNEGLFGKLRGLGKTGKKKMVKK